MAQGSPSRSATILLTAVAVVALGVYGYQQAARGIRVRRQKAADAQQQARVDKLIMAAVRGNVQAIRSMEHGITKSDALLMLQTAVYYGHADVVHEVFGLQLVPEQAPEIASGLHQAASLGYDDVLLELMKHGGDPNGVSGYVAPLPLAAVCGYPDVVTVLLASRARKDVRAFGIGTRGIEGMSPVGLAGIYGRPDVVRLLLARGFRPSLLDISTLRAVTDKNDLPRLAPTSDPFLPPRARRMIMYADERRNYRTAAQLLLAAAPGGPGALQKVRQAVGQATN